MSDEYTIDGAASPLSPVGAKLFGADASGNVGWMRKPTGIRAGIAPIRVATFGDSTASLGHVWTVGGVASPDLSEINLPLPGSGTTSLTYGGQGKNSASLFAPEARVVWSGGVSGENTTQMLARDSAAASLTRRAITDLIAVKPDVVILRAGSINDVMALTAATGTQALIDAIYDRHVKIISRIMLSGAFIVDEGLFGYSAAVGAEDLAYRRAVLVELNARFASLVSVFGAHRYAFLSPVGILSDTAGAYLTGVSSDGVHILDARGSLALGAAEAAVIQSVFGNNRRAIPATNLFSNPVFAVESSTTWGSWATGISFSASGKTRDSAAIERINGVPFTLVSGIGGGAGSIENVIALGIDGATPAISISEGDKLYISADAYIKNTHTVEQSFNVSLVLDFYHTDGRRINIQWQENLTPLAPGESRLLCFEFPPFVSPIASSDIKSTTTAKVIFSTLTTGDFRCGIGNVRVAK